MWIIHFCLKSEKCFNCSKWKINWTFPEVFNVEQICALAFAVVRTFGIATKLRELYSVNKFRIKWYELRAIPWNLQFVFQFSYQKTWPGSQQNLLKPPKGKTLNFIFFLVKFTQSSNSCTLCRLNFFKRVKPLENTHMRFELMATLS